MPTLNDNELGSALFGLSPKQAIAYLKAKGLYVFLVLAGVWQASHATEYDKAKVTRLDIPLQTFIRRWSQLGFEW